MLLTTAAAPAAPAAAQDGAPVATFRVFLGGRAIGTESVRVTRAAGGWTLAGSGRLEAPVNLDTRRLEIVYDEAGHPRTVDLDAILRGEVLAMQIGFGPDVATATITRGDEESVIAHRVSAGSIVLSDSFFASYELMAQRLSALDAGAEVPAYFTGQGEIPVRLDRVLEERIQTPDRRIVARRHLVTFLRPNGPFGGEVWSDEHGRLLRLSLPTARIEILREDIATVNARRQTLSRAGDEDVRIPSIGFSLAGTLSQPAGEPGPRGHPAIVLVPGSSAQDRDEVIDGIPVAGLLAHALADAGFYVLRYDRRGVAQSGGRPEASRLQDYAQDALAAVELLRDRDEVDRELIAVLGRADAGLIALQAAARERDVKRLVLVGTPSVPGTEQVLEQQRRALARSNLSPEEQQQRIELQERIHAAVLGEGDWEGISRDVRRQADTAWFRSLLAFDPAAAIERTRQPMLIVDLGASTALAPHHAGRLVELAEARDRNGGVELARVDGVDDRLVRVDDSPASSDAAVAEISLAPAVIDAIVGWLRRPPAR